MVTATAFTHHKGMIVTGLVFSRLPHFVDCQMPKPELVIEMTLSNSCQVRQGRHKDVGCLDRSASCCLEGARTMRDHSIRVFAGPIDGVSQHVTARLLGLSTDSYLRCTTARQQRKGQDDQVVGDRYGQAQGFCPWTRLRRRVPMHSRSRQRWGGARCDQCGLPATGACVDSRAAFLFRARLARLLHNWCRPLATAQ